MRKLKKKRNYSLYIIIACVGIFSIMGVGYAYLQEALTMNVHMSKKSPDFATDSWETIAANVIL